MKTPPQKPTTPQEVPKSEARDATTESAAPRSDPGTGHSGLSIGKLKWFGKSLVPDGHASDDVARRYPFVELQVPGVGSVLVPEFFGDKPGDLEKTSKEGYSRLVDIAAVIKPTAEIFGLSIEDTISALEERRAKVARETTGRATAKLRPPETAPVAEREPPRPAQQRTAQELFGMSASTPARRYHKSDGPEFCEAELADRVLLAAAEATRNEMKTRRCALKLASTWAAARSRKPSGWRSDMMLKAPVSPGFQV